jgi:hypothetical protein
MVAILTRYLKIYINQNIFFLKNLLTTPMLEDYLYRDEIF